MAVPQPQIIKRCPACGRVSATASRCRHCLRDLAQVLPLAPNEAAAALRLQADLEARRSATRLTARRARRLGSLTVVALLAGWWGYAVLIDQPTRPIAPSSMARSAAAGAWTTQDGDNRGTRSTAARAQLGGAEAWRAALHSPAATPLVTDGVVLVVPLQDGRLVGLETSTGEQRWTVALNNAPLAAPVIAGDRIYVAHREGFIAALEVSSGNGVWHTSQIAGAVGASPLVVEGVVYVFSTEGLFAFDAEEGRRLWAHPFAAGWAPVAPVVEGRHLVIAAADKAIVFDRATGERSYYLTFSRTQPSSIAIRDGLVVSLYGRIVTAFEASSRRPWWDRLANVSIGGGSIRSAWFRLHLYGMAPAVPRPPLVWDVTSLPRRTMAAAVGQDIVVVASPDGAVTALRRADGALAWKVTTGRLVAAPVVTADGVLLTEEDRLLLLDAGTGEQRAERRVEGLRGATVDAATYVATAAGEVIALR